MIKADYHVHSVYSDGTDDIESIILHAEKIGMKEIGISDHSYTYFDESYCMQKHKIKEYVAKINALKKKYEGRINVYCGIELDFFSDIDLSDYDYVIGSSHYLKRDDKFYPLDESREIFITTVQKLFGGDYYSACEEYFSNVSKFAFNEKVNIIGHLDIIAKYNGKAELFDEENERYVKAYTKAIKALIAAGKIFEINTADLRRGLRNDVYPSEEIRNLIRDLGGKFILSSDSHKKEDLMFGFELYEKEL